MNPKYLPHSIISSLVFLEILSVAAANSWAPWAILFHGNTVLRVLGWYLAVQLCISIFAFVFFNVVPDDTRCGICFQNLKAYIPVYGPPEICYRCNTWFHKNCYASKRKRCPVCFPESSGESEIPFDFTSEFPRH